MMNGFDLDERRSAGKVLVLPNAPWGSKPESDPNHYVAPELAPSDQQLADRALACSIADQMIATVSADLCQAAAEAYQASQEAARALNNAQAEYAQLQAPAPSGLSIDELGQRRLRKLGIADHVEDLRKANDDAGAYPPCD